MISFKEISSHSPDSKKRLHPLVKSLILERQSSIIISLPFNRLPSVIQGLNYNRSFFFNEVNGRFKSGSDSERDFASLLGSPDLQDFASPFQKNLLPKGTRPFSFIWRRFLSTQRQHRRESIQKAASQPVKTESIGIISVQSTQNNTILTLTDALGNTKGWTSSGCLGFRNTRKSTTYAAQAAAEKIAGKALGLGFDRVRVKVKGLGYGKQSSVRALHKSGLRVVSIEEVTPISYNGCRLLKKRRT